MKIISEKNLKESSTKTPYPIVIDFYLYADGHKERVSTEKAPSSRQTLARGTAVDYQIYKHSDGSITICVTTISEIGRDKNGPIKAQTWLSFDSAKDVRENGWSL